GDLEGALAAQETCLPAPKPPRSPRISISLLGASCCCRHAPTNGSTQSMPPNLASARLLLIVRPLGPPMVRVVVRSAETSTSWCHQRAPASTSNAVEPGEPCLPWDQTV